jgi:tetratricopeptide (TPR) repeat protein
MNRSDPRSLISHMRGELWEGRFDAAFDMGEELLDSELDAECYEEIINLIDRAAPRNARARLVALLRQVERDRSTHHVPWRRYLRFVLLSRLSLVEEAFAASVGLTQLPARYGWMRFDRAGLLLSRLWAYEQAIVEYEATLASTPRFWKAVACRAEAELCLGRQDRAHAILDECVRGLRDRGLEVEETLAIIWRAELRLWTGDYAQALEDLEDPARRGYALALGWRGAASLLLGDPAQALADLDQALAADPRDGEAVVWRAEALAHQERWDEAVVEFSRAAAMTHPPVWPLIGRALVKERLGDRAGFLADLDRLSGPDVGLLRATSGRTAPPDLGRTAAWLEALRAGARGIRRPEQWLRPLWMKPEAWLLEDGVLSVSDRPTGWRPPSGRLASMFGLAEGQRLSVPGVGDVRVRELPQDSETIFRVALDRANARPIIVLVSTTPTEQFFCISAKGNYLSFVGDDATPEEVRAVKELARHV